jgi:hypothetical protein
MRRIAFFDGPTSASATCTTSGSYNDLSSYAALVVAVLDAGLVPTTTLVCPSEMRGSIHINSADSSRVDSIFVLRKPPVEVVGDRATAVFRQAHPRSFRAMYFLAKAVVKRSVAVA